LQPLSPPSPFLAIGRPTDLFRTPISSLTCTQITPPFDPKVSDPFDLRNIDPDFVREEVVATGTTHRV
jgi:hypothetical protein